MRPVLSAIVLAGGSSRRMGSDKRSIEVDGRPMLTRAVRLAARVTQDVVVSCRAEAPPDPRLFDGVPVRLVFDGRDGGPLAGLEASLDAVANDLAVILAVDMPAVTELMVWRLAEAAVERPEAGASLFVGVSGLVPFPAVLRRKTRLVVSAQLDRGCLRVADALLRLDPVTVPERAGTFLAGPMAFLNVNGPQDLASVAHASPAGRGTTEPRTDEERTMDLEQCLAVACGSSGRILTKAVAPTAEETAALLDFTRAVAHAGERKDAPLAAYAMGIAMAGLTPSERADVLSRSAAAVDEAAAAVDEAATSSR